MDSLAARGQAGEGVHDQAALVLAGGVAVALEATGVQEGDGLLGLIVVRAPEARGADEEGRQDEGKGGGRT
jgi:hypothetical protein